MRWDTWTHDNCQSFQSLSHGFISGKSCVSKLVELLDEITEALEQGDKVDIMDFEVCKTFDKMLHKWLLKRYGGME